jgi:CopG family transcriptional regulator, nickel-responsive regulator
MAKKKKSGIMRFGVSLSADLLRRFDRLIREESYANRSEALRDMMRTRLVRKEWQDENREVVGSVTLVYDHHRRELARHLTDIQHEFHQVIISTQHIHLDHDNCLEIIVLKGRVNELLKLTALLKATKGVKFGELTMASTGRQLK